MRRSFVMLVGLVATLWLSSSAAWAGPQWCEEDPEFVVNGALVDVTTLFPGGYASYVSGPVNFNLQVPSNVVAAAVKLPGTIPVTATISRTLPAYYGLLSIPVVVTVSMNSSVAFQTYTQITGLGGSVFNSVYGSSTWPTKAKFYMYGL
jgi:hypothetical protein